jgi:hypothetical protein
LDVTALGRLLLLIIWVLVLEPLHNICFITTLYDEINYLEIVFKLIVSRANLYASNVCFQKSGQGGNFFF